MICLNNTDTLEGGASVNAVVDYTVHGLVGTTFTQIAQGQLSNTNPSVLYTAGAAISIVAITLVNTHTSAVTVDLYIDPTNAGTPRRLIPKTMGLGIGYSLVFDGARFAVFDANGVFMQGMGVSDTAYAASWDGVTTIAPSKNAVYDKMETKAAAGANTDITSLRALLYDIQIYNLKPIVNASVNKLDIFTKSGGAAPDASNPIIVSIPDGNGFTNRTRNAAYLSGTSQFIMADAANYWSKGSLDAEIKTAYIYAIWDTAGGIVWALGGYSGFTRCPASTTATDDDFFLLEASSTYTKVITDYCICVGKIRYQYDTADTPDHTIQATVLDAPQVIWNPKSDYGKQINLSTTLTQGSDIAEYSVLSAVVKQSRKFKIHFQVLGVGASANGGLTVYIKTGSSTYASATNKGKGANFCEFNYVRSGTPITAETYLNAGDTIHGGASLVAASGNRIIAGDDHAVGSTVLIFNVVD